MNSIFNYQLLISALLGAMIGLEREISGKDPNLRTFALICMGSCIFTILSVQAATLAPNSDPGRIAAQLVVGIGFIGAGTIYKSGKDIRGLTTAALMWVTAGIGMAVGYNQEKLAISATVTSIAITYILRLVRNIVERYRPKKQEPSNKYDDS